MSGAIKADGTPKEFAEQKKVIKWWHWAARTYGCEPWELFHVPNGGFRNPKEAAGLYAQGVRAGYPDLALDVPRGQYHGLRIELKTVSNGKVSEAQKKWIAQLSKRGYLAVICRGANEAIKAIEGYFTKT